MADNLAERIAELEALAIERDVRDQVGDMPGDPEMYAGALADAIGLDKALATDPAIELDMIERALGINPVAAIDEEA